MIKAWHFVGDTLRDGRPIPANGEVLRHDGPLVMCESGLHASVSIIDALAFAPGHTICRVTCGGAIEHAADRLVCTERAILWRVNGEKLLREFARERARSVLHLWDAPDVVRQYLATGDETIRAAARDVAWTAARTAGWAAARDADTASAATSAAGWTAARAAAAASAASWDAARDAAWDAAGAAARAEASAAPWAEAMVAANDTLERMVIAAHEAET